MDAIYYARWMVGVAVMVAALPGCGGKHEMLYPVAGKVTFRGKPVSAGMIRLCNPRATIDMLAVLGPDGTYRVVRAQGPGLPQGTYQVAVMPAMADDPIGPIGPKKPVNSPDIPKKYRQPGTSGLAMTVKPDNNRFEIDLQP
jgi:hypothetical protein